MADKIQFKGGRASKDDLESVEKTKVEGAIKVQRIALHWIGTIVVILALGGVGAFFFCPEKARDLWTVISPIILAAVTGTLGFLAGEKAGKKMADE